jgi:hypothetical protein
MLEGVTATIQEDKPVPIGDVFDHRHVRRWPLRQPQQLGKSEAVLQEYRGVLEEYVRTDQEPVGLGSKVTQIELPKGRRRPELLGLVIPKRYRELGVSRFKLILRFCNAGHCPRSLALAVAATLLATH